MAESPLVSVIVPVYNGESYLRFALESVVRQDHRPIEIIVVDDGSTDGSPAIAKGFPEVRYLHQANSGVAAARNAGVSAAKGSFIAFLDQDDLWQPGKLGQQLAYLNAHPQAMYVLCGMENFDESGGEPRAATTQDLETGETHNLSLGSLLARRTMFDRVGMFDPAYLFSSDVDWFVRAKEEGFEFATLPGVLLRRRVHAANESHRNAERTREHLRVLKSAMERRRKKARA